MKSSELIATAIAAVWLPTAGQSATIVQTVHSTNNSNEWNDAIWGSPAATPSAGNDYVSAAGLASATTTNLGLSVTGRVRAYASSASGTFLGDSLKLVSSTELLIKETGTYNADIILDGGVVRFSPDNRQDATLTGSMTVGANSVLGVVQSSSGVSSLTVNASLLGSSTLRVAAAQSLTGFRHTVSFGGDLSDFTGTLDIGGGERAVTIDFNQNYNGDFGLWMGRYATADVLQLDQAVAVASFAFNSVPLAAGTYSSAALNGLFGNGSQFTGNGSLTVVPEPSSLLLLAGGISAFIVRRRRPARSSRIMPFSGNFSAE